MIDYKIVDITKLEIYNIYGTVHAVLERENNSYSLCESEFKYPGNEKLVDLNGEDLFRYMENLNLEWKLLENLASQE